MELVIKLSDKEYSELQSASYYRFDKYTAYLAMKDGTLLPEHHGRLIDADALEYTCNADECGMLTGCNHCQYHIVTEHEIDDAPTIIEGSDSE